MDLSKDQVETERTRGAKQPSLADRIYADLNEQINRGAFPADQKLPSEHALAERFGVSRPIIREALSRLRDDGRIYSRQGAGSFVSRDMRAGVLAFAPIENIADIQRCYEFRMTIEPEAARAAARRHDEKALANILNQLNHLRSATRHHKHREDADFLFHLSIAQASNNHYFASAFEALREHIAVGMKFHGLALLGAQTQLNYVFSEHESIFQAISEGDGDTAFQRMHEHLAGSRDRLFEGRMLDLSVGRDAQ